MYSATILALNFAEAVQLHVSPSRACALAYAGVCCCFPQQGIAQNRSELSKIGTTDPARSSGMEEQQAPEPAPRWASMLITVTCTVTFLLPVLTTSRPCRQTWTRLLRSASGLLNYQVKQVGRAGRSSRVEQAGSTSLDHR